MIEMDFNAKLGNEIIKGDPHKMSRNGIHLWQLVQKRQLKVVNSLDKCKGSITRSKKTINGNEKSIIDFVIYCF